MLPVTSSNLSMLLHASVIDARAKRWFGPIKGEVVKVYRVFGASADEAMEVFARDEVEAVHCARAIDAKLRSYAGTLVCRYIRTVAVPKRKELVA